MASARSRIEQAVMQQVHGGAPPTSSSAGTPAASREGLFGRLGEHGRDGDTRPAASTGPQPARAAAPAAGVEGSAPQAAPAPESPIPFSRTQVAWMANAVSAANVAAMTAFGEALGEELESVRADVAQVRFTVEETAVRVERHTSQIDSIAERVDAATASSDVAMRAVENLETRFAALLADGGMAKEARVVARIGGLGWDSTPEDLHRAATEVLTEAGILPNAHGAVAAVLNRAGRGSSAETVFTNDGSLQTARIAVRALRKELVPGRYVWLDAARTRAELRPIRALHRAADILQDVEAARPDRLPITRDAGARAVSAGGQRVFQVARDQLIWTPAGARRYAESERRDAACAAVAE